MFVENWRPIAGWPGYEVSDCGNVRSFKRSSSGRKFVARYDLPSRDKKQRLLNGYPAVVLSDNGKKKDALVHSLVLEAFVSSRPEGMQAAHNDGNKRNNTVANLRWATPVENNADKIAHGTHQVGVKATNVKLSEDSVREIRRLYAEGVSAKKLSATFGTCLGNIWNIVLRLSWSHI